MIRNHIFPNGAIHLPRGLESVRRVILINSQGLSINTVFCSVQLPLWTVCIFVLAKDSSSIYKDLEVFRREEGK